MNNLLTQIKISFGVTFFLAILLCGLYPLLVWGFAQAVFPAKANGSLVIVDGQLRGSFLLAQNFAGARYFHPRPSAAGAGYDAASSGGSNLGPISKKLLETAANRAAAYRTENGLAAAAIIPADAVTTSASGLDPHISPENVLLQERRVAQSRGLSAETMRSLVAKHTMGRDWGILGEPRINVLELNLALDEVR